MNRSILLFVFSIVLVIYKCNCFRIPSDNECSLPQEIIEDIQSYTNVTAKILENFIIGPNKGRTWKLISEFVDKFPMRLTGSRMLEDSIDYLFEESNKNNLENVHKEELNVPYWSRGEESVTVIKPRERNIPMLGLGTSIGTPPDGITAHGLVVQSFDDLQSLSYEQVKGKIVIFNQPYTDYSDTVDYRYDGAVESAKKGAVASLIRSITPFSIASAHTGAQEYQANVTKIPTACITVEDAEYLWREQQRGNEIVINIIMLPTEETRTSHNLISEITGSVHPEKIVMVSGHIDSWDVGTGAMDDAGGCFVSWLAPLFLKEQGLRPRRTLRTVIFTSEEQGIVGANVYAIRHNDTNFNFVMESDFGTFAPLGLQYSGSDMGECMMKEILKQFESIGASELVKGNPGPDVKVWVRRGVSGAGLHNADYEYFWYHHSEGDTLNVLSSDELDMNAAFWTAVSYIIADMKFDVPKAF